MAQTNSKIKLEKITIIGLGVIGSSFSLALKRFNPQLEICGYDLEKSYLKKAQELGIVDNYSLKINEAVHNADLVVAACSLNQLVPMMLKVIPYMKKDSILTDVGSVKEGIITAVEKNLPSDIYYVPGHPMAGSEKRGLDGADTYLFENAAYILTPTARTSKAALNTVLGLVRGLGARPLIMSPFDHDRQVATVSHLPHIAAASLVNTAQNLRGKYPDLLLLAAGGFRDTTRIASSQPEMWQDICLNNKEAILEVLDIYETGLKRLKNAILKGEGNNIYQEFANAQRGRADIPAGIKGILPELFEIVVVVPDKPGMIGQIAAQLGEKDINIIDIEILRVREGDGGTMRFGFTRKAEAEKAAEVLREQEFKVYPRF